MRIINGLLRRVSAGSRSLAGRTTVHGATDCKLASHDEMRHLSNLRSGLVNSRARNSLLVTHVRALARSDLPGRSLED